ncbi:hypothetical protein KUF88_08990 [Streptococcus equi subsp. zooepidemicus]|uniref:hypothetical protein n=1 Tax=Streptococcus equi TaxID=1336 RepID=UPI0005A19DEC|nr:hypothetical protein [Streptococcus equi]MCD3374800.1 hypothetical protein [Streptococcus equi subsp. zooepidemicus]MCD3376990.1 hypothetical protein [Streptococcus equi subsp. zooepidemicus]MDI5915269.1 hypothetical protein [Streptococcus equi subsp. zooepidemicus]HEL0606152.1 hypothetical protein [Streptococcus equi subsp. zooepidemicus]HEL1164353.1 hypothetical protein [Streptococcus equi subsp. zooepidemicus]
MIPITTKARAVLNLFNTPELRAKASEKARNHGLLAGVTADSLALAELLKNREGIDTDSLQEFYAQGLIAFYDYASTHYYVGVPNISMLDKFLNGDKIYWKSYS